MIAKSGIGALGLGALVVAGLAVSPALLAKEQRPVRALAAREALPMPLSGGLGLFTPASGDPKLSAMLARNGMGATDFHFTPSSSRAVGNRPVTVAVRARSVRGDPVAAVAAGDALAAIAPQAPAVAPIAYNLGVSVGWKRFAASGDLAKLDLGTQQGVQERAAPGAGYAGKRVQAVTPRERSLSDGPALPGIGPSEPVGLGGSYKLTRNLDVTAGVRHRSERERLLRDQSERRDHQSVYLGTAFRF